MKKLSSCLFLLIIVLFYSCKMIVDPIHSDVTYYNIKNSTNNEVVIKFHRTDTVGRAYIEPIYTLQSGESSEIFEGIMYSPHNIKLITSFIRTSDSIDMYVNNVLVKRYKRSESYPKSPYNKVSYDTVVKDKEGRDINVYTILNSDFE